MLHSVTLIPAYGRKYKTVEDMLIAWNAGKDFMIRELQCYCSIRDLPEFRRQMYYVCYKHTDGQVIWLDQT